MRLGEELSGAFAGGHHSPSLPRADGVNQRATGSAAR